MTVNIVCHPACGEIEQGLESAKPKKKKVTETT